MDNNQDKKNKNEERHAMWLELFYDLVFVVSISQLSHYLLHDVSLSNFLDSCFSLYQFGKDCTTFLNLVNHIFVLSIIQLDTGCLVP